MKKVVVLSGLSGSGKSMFACKLALFRPEPKRYIVSADDYFNCDGNYKFDPANLSQAHAACFRNFIDHLNGSLCGIGDKIVIVDNTNLTKEEISPYMLGAAAFGYDAEIVMLRVEPSVALSRNIHNVSFTAHKRQLEKFDVLSTTLYADKRWKHINVYPGHPDPRRNGLALIDSYVG